MYILFGINYYNILFTFQCVRDLVDFILQSTTKCEKRFLENTVANYYPTEINVEIATPNSGIHKGF